jgi:molybdenum cofactor cytidylyltransferase
MIAGLLLGAGRGSRFGGDKLLAPLRGQPVMFWSAATLGSMVDSLYVVLPPGDEGRRAALSSLPCTMVEHAGRDDGLGSSIGAGVAALAEDAEAVVVVLADQPLVSREAIRTVRERWREGGVEAVSPHYRDGPGHPVLFGRSTFAALRALQGDRGARDLLERLGDSVAIVPVDETKPIDVDTPEALRLLAAAWHREGGASPN